MTLGDICVTIASCFYVFAGIGYFTQSDYPRAVAFICWAVANGAVVMAGKAV